MVKKSGSSLQARLGVVSRCVAAIGGGYALAALSNVVLALTLALPREEAVMAASMPAFLIFAAAVAWAFCARTAWLAWAGIGGPALVLALAVWWLKPVVTAVAV